MRIDGKEIAAKIFEELATQVEELKKQSINPHVAIILVGEDESSKTYVRQKELKAQKIGVETTIKHFPKHISQKDLLSTIQQLNNEKTIHGIIVQRPLPNHINEKILDEAVLPQKDIDSFHSNSPYQMPLAAAVIKILEEVYSLKKSEEQESRSWTSQDDVILGSPAQRNDSRISTENSLSLPFTNWLAKQNIVVIGKGKTGGGPTIDLLKHMGINPSVIDSKTQNREELLKNADIVISAVGKPHVIKGSDLNPGVILVGVGMHRNDEGKLQGDYNEENIKDIASSYTPIPGGIGPVNVAMLLKNLIQAVKYLEKQS